MKDQNVLCTSVCGKARTMLFSGLLLATVFSCKKESNEILNPEAVAAVTSSTSLVANPNLIYEETFEGSSYFPITGTTLNKTHAVENCNNNSTVTPATYDWTLGRRTSPVFQQTNAVRFEIRKGQPLVKSGTRSEVTIIKGTEDARFTPEMWYSFAMLIPTVGGENDRRVSINQWFEDGSKETTLRTENGKCYLETASTIPTKRYDIFSTAVTSDETSASFANHPRDKWTEVVFHFIHSLGSNGLIEIFRDGVKIHTINGPNMHLELPKWKLGLYGAMDRSTLSSKAIYFDNIRVGKATATLADMSSTFTTPPPTSTPPTTSITSPAANATFNGPATITINATAADSDGTISSVAFYNGITLLGTDDTSPYSYTWSNVAAGNYSLTSRATDNSGSTTTSSAVPVSVNVVANGAPVVSITSPAANTSYDAPASITINASASDADGTISAVAFYNGATLLGTDNSSPYSYTWNNVAAGNYSITAKATDNTGAATTSSPVTVTVSAVTPPPTGSMGIASFTLINAGTDVEIMTITNGATISLSQIGTGKLNIRANPNSSIDKVTFVLSGAQSQTYTDKLAPFALKGDNGSGNYYYGNWNPAALGTYTLKATPGLGTVTGTSSTISFTFVQ